MAGHTALDRRIGVRFPYALLYYKQGLRLISESFLFMYKYYSQHTSTF